MSVAAGRLKEATRSESGVRRLPNLKVASECADKEGMKIKVHRRESSSEQEALTSRAFVIDGLILTVIVVGVFVAVFAVRPKRVLLEYGWETTRFSGPLNQDGTVDYVTIVERQASAGVTAEENAAMPLVEALVGPGDDDSVDFLRQHGFVVREDNAWTNPFDFPLDDFDLWDAVKETSRSPWHADEFPLVKAWIESNEVATALIRDAARRSKFYLPLQPTSAPKRLDNSRTPLSLIDVRGAYLLLTAAGYLDLAAEKRLAAWRTARDVVNLSAHVGRILFVIWSGFAYEAYESGARLAHDVVVSATLPPQLARQLLEDLETWPAPTAATTIVERWRLELLDFVSGCWAGEGYEEDWIDLCVPPNAQFDPHPILRRIHHKLDMVLDAYARGETITQRHRPTIQGPSWMRKILKHGREISRSLVPRLAVNKFVSYALDSSICAGVDENERHARTRLSLTRAALALSIFCAETGDSPSSLNDLVPEILATVPLDHIARRPLRYRCDADGWTLWAVGYNGRDDGGHQRLDFTLHSPPLDATAPELTRRHD